MDSKSSYTYHKFKLTEVQKNSLKSYLSQVLNNEQVEHHYHLMIKNENLNGDDELMITHTHKNKILARLKEIEDGIIPKRKSVSFHLSNTMIKYNRSCKFLSIPEDQIDNLFTFKKKKKVYLINDVPSNPFIISTGKSMTCEIMKTLIDKFDDEVLSPLINDELEENLRRIIVQYLAKKFTETTHIDLFSSLPPEYQARTIRPSLHLIKKKPNREVDEILFID